jgi:hypothetical protein
VTLGCEREWSCLLALRLLWVFVMVTHHYVRHGTTTLFEALEIATGKRCANVLSYSLSGAGEIDLSLVAKKPGRSVMSMSPLQGSRSLACPTRIRCRPTSG